ncbi:MAG TPA: PAS domain-containing protein [Candidatus Hydrogenedentes bacterium]|nr:PAS domain-containing protein [Candidatus Hydrogenedentota bacterium]
MLTQDVMAVHPKFPARLEFETLLADLAARFVNIPSDEVDREIAEALSKLCECLGVNRASLWQASETDPGRWPLTHVYPPPVRSVPEDADLKRYFPWGASVVLGGKILALTRVTDTPPEAARDRESWKKYSTKSTLGLPLSAGGAPVFGVVAFADVKTERDWPEAIVNRCSLIAQVFANALARKRADRALRENEERFRSIALNLPGIVYQFYARENGQWGMHYVDANAVDVCGLSPEPVDTFFERFVACVAPECRDLWLTSVREAIRCVQPWEQDTRFIKPTGEEVYLRAFSRPMRLHGEIVFSGLVRDVTEQKRAEIALRESHVELASRLEFETLVSNLSAEFAYLAPGEVDHAIERALDAVRRFFQTDRCGLLSVCQNRRSVFVTHASYSEGVDHVPSDVNLAELFPWGYKRLIIAGEPMLIPKLAELPPEAEKDRQSYIAMGARSNLSIPLFVSQDAWYIIAVQTVREERNWHDDYVSRLRLLGEVFVNALERKKADEALRESEMRLRLATDMAEVGIWAMDVDTRSIWFSNRMRALFHFGAEEELSYQRFLDVIHPDDRQRVEEAIQQSLQTGGNFHIDHRVVTPSGGGRWIATRGRPEGAAQGGVTRLLCLSIDIDSRKQVEAVLHDFGGRMIQAVEKERAHFAREIHDDFNQRLALLAVELDMLRQGSLLPAEAMRQKLSEFSSLVKDLSADLQRLSRQFHPAKLAQLGLVAALQSLCRETSAKSGVQVGFFAADAPRLLPNDVSLCLYRIAQEALQNVVRHSESKDAMVKISTRDGWITLSISDSGRGFVVEPGQSTAGLGFISMQERARHANGELTVTTEPGRGTRVEARIPFGGKGKD